VIAGILLALCAGVGSYVLLSRAQQAAGTVTIPKAALVVATHTITARTPITAGDLAIREVPMDTTNAQGTFNAIDQVVGRTAGVTILQGQLVTSNLFTFSAGTASVAILDPGESITPDSPDWRAVSISVPDDRAVGGVLSAGEHNPAAFRRRSLRRVPQDRVAADLECRRDHRRPVVRLELEQDSGPRVVQNRVPDDSHRRSARASPAPRCSSASSTSW